MKFATTFHTQSAPQWAPFNVDYHELKYLIRTHTLKSQNRAIPIPGQKDILMLRFENLFYHELLDQHDRVDLFVKSKIGEINRRLHFLKKQVMRYITKVSTNIPRKPLSPPRNDKLARYDGQIESCGDDIRCLQRFVAAQRMAFEKILKKYTKWTGSRGLTERFTDNVLGNPKSFTRWDSDPLISLYTELLTSLRTAFPEFSEITSPIRRNPRPPKTESPTPEAELQPQCAYWNEYDNGSEIEGEPYLVYIDPDVELFPGARTLRHVFSKAMKPIDKFKQWFKFVPTSGERQPLLGHAHDNAHGQHSQGSVNFEADEEVYASSLDYSTGRVTYCAADPVSNSHRERLFFSTMVGSFAASFVLLLVSGLLAVTGKKRLRVKVDAGVIVGVVASLGFATMGVCLMRCRNESLSWTHRFSVVVTYMVACFLNSILLVEVTEKY